MTPQRGTLLMNEPHGFRLASLDKRSRPSACSWLLLLKKQTNVRTGVFALTATHDGHYEAKCPHTKINCIQNSLASV